MTKIDIQVATEQKDIPGIEQLKLWTKTALTRSGNYELTLRIVDEDESAALNQQWRKKDRATNVLSFPYGDDEHVPNYLGDIVICAPVISREAEEQGKPVEAHWAHMVIHGILHLRGYDHNEKNETEEMEDLEIKLLGNLGLKNPYQPD